MFKYQIDALEKLIIYNSVDTFLVENYTVIKIEMYNLKAYVGFKSEIGSSLKYEAIVKLKDNHTDDPERVKELVTNNIVDLMLRTSDLHNPEAVEEITVDDFESNFVEPNEFKIIRSRIFRFLKNTPEVHWDYDDSDRELLTCDNPDIFALFIWET